MQDNQNFSLHQRYGGSLSSGQSVFLTMGEMVREELIMNLRTFKHNSATILKRTELSFSPLLAVSLCLGACGFSGFNNYRWHSD